MRTLFLILFLFNTANAQLVNPPRDSSLQFSDITTGNFSITKHGFVPKGTNTGTAFLRDDATWAVPPGGGSTNMALNNFTANGVSTTFILNSNPSVEENTFVYLSGVYQDKSTYSVSGTSLIFSVAPVSGTSVEAMVGTVSGTGGGGEVNTASNLGAGVGVFGSKSGVDLRFRSILSSNSNLTVATSGTTELNFGFLTTPVVSGAVISVQSVNASAPSAGRETLFNRDGNYTSINSSSETSILPKTYTAIMTATSSTTSTTHGDVPQLVSTSLGTGYYKIMFDGEYATSATAVGAGFRLTNGTATIGTMSVLWKLRQASDGVDSFFDYGQNTTAANIVSTGVTAQNTNFSVQGYGYFSLTASGTVKVQFRSEISPSATTLAVGSNYTVMKVK